MHRRSAHCLPGVSEGSWAMTTEGPCSLRSSTRPTKRRWSPCGWGTGCTWATGSLGAETVKSSGPTRRVSAHTGSVSHTQGDFLSLPPYTLANVQRRPCAGTSSTRPTSRRFLQSAPCVCPAGPPAASAPPTNTCLSSGPRLYGAGANTCHATTARSMHIRARNVSQSTTLHWKK